MSEREDPRRSWSNSETEKHLVGQKWSNALVIHMEQNTWTAFRVGGMRDSL